MPIKALKSVLKKDRQAKILIDELCNKMDIEIAVVNNLDQVIWGNRDNGYSHSFPIQVNRMDVGTVLSNQKDGVYIADMIALLAKKEFEKKKIGSEVLGLYREINMIYDFSEKISEKIDAASIANMALSEASQIIDCSHGLFLMYDSNVDEVVELASFGDSPSQSQEIIKHGTLLKHLILKGTSSIIETEALSVINALSHLKSLMYAPLKVKHRNLGLLMLGHQETKDFTAAELKLLTTIAIQSASAIESAHLYQKGLREAKEREEAIRKIHDVSTKFVPFEFIHALGKTKLTEVRLGDQVEREVTVVFADIRDFTSLSETMAPEDNFHFINAFNKRIGPIIRQHNGFIIQYLGDGFMAIFPNGTQDALRASVAMHKLLATYNRERKSKNRSAIKIGIGMQNGKLIMGITGDVERMEASTISDTVNTAARIEGLSKHFGTYILLTESCIEDLVIWGWLK